MKTKLLVLINKHAIWIIIIAYIAVQQIQNYNLKQMLIKDKKVQQELLKKGISERNKLSDSLIVKFNEVKNAIDTILKNNEKLKIQRTKNTEYYAKKIDDVRNTSNDSIARFLSNYHYSSN